MADYIPNLHFYSRDVYIPFLCFTDIFAVEDFQSCNWPLFVGQTKSPRNGQMKRAADFLICLILIQKWLLETPCNSIAAVQQCHQLGVRFLVLCARSSTCALNAYD